MEEEYTEKTDEEIKELAKLYHRGMIYGSWMVEDSTSLYMIFLPLAFVDDNTLKDFKDRDVVHFYSEMKDASPRSINGQPMFMSMYYFTRNEYTKFVEYVNKLIEMEKNL